MPAVLPVKPRQARQLPPMPEAAAAILQRQALADQKKEAEAAPLTQPGCDHLICDGCSTAWHGRCVTPPVTTVPEGEWHCPTLP